MARKPFKKHLTPIGRGGIDTHIGKGAREQVRGPAGDETLTGGDSFARMGNRYPKPAPEELAPEPAPEPAPPVPLGPAPGRGPTALMPPGPMLPDDDEAA